MSGTAQVNGPSGSQRFIDGVDPDNDDYIKNLQRPAEVKEDIHQMENRSRVKVVLNSECFKEELEQIVDEQIRNGPYPASLLALQQINELLMPSSRGGLSNLARASTVIPINDLKGADNAGFAKGEKLLRCKVAALYRLIDLHGWSEGIYNHISARVSSDEEHFLLNAFGMTYSEVTASSLIKVNVNGETVDQGTSHFGISKAGFILHSAIHQARPDIKCIIHLHTPAGVAVSAMKCGLLPLCQEALFCGNVSYHDYHGVFIDSEEKEKLALDLGVHNKVLILRNHGVVACGETVEEAFYFANNLMLACEAQIRAIPIGLDNLHLPSEEVRQKAYRVGTQGGGGVETQGKKWRCGEMEFEALMRQLDNSGYRTGHMYKVPMIKQEKKDRSNSEVEIPPSSSSFTYVFDGDFENSKYVSPLKMAQDRQKKAFKAGWLTSPNAYKKTEVEEIGTTTPKKITRWVSEGGESPNKPGCVQVKLEHPNQFAPQGENPKEFKQKQKSIRKDYYEEKVNAGPQSKILDGISLEEAQRAKDGQLSGAGDQVIVVGAASKGIIQRDHQHNAVVYRQYYAANPFENMSEAEIEHYQDEVQKRESSQPAESTEPQNEVVEDSNKVQEAQDTEEVISRQRNSNDFPNISDNSAKLDETGQDEVLARLANTVVQTVMHEALAVARRLGGKGQQILTGSTVDTTAQRGTDSLYTKGGQIIDHISNRAVRDRLGDSIKSSGNRDSCNKHFNTKSFQHGTFGNKESCPPKQKSLTHSGVPGSSVHIDEEASRGDTVTLQINPILVQHSCLADGMKIKFSVHSTVRRRISAELEQESPIEEIFASATQPTVYAPHSHHSSGIHRESEANYTTKIESSKLDKDRDLHVNINRHNSYFNSEVSSLSTNTVTEKETKQKVEGKVEEKEERIINENEKLMQGAGTTQYLDEKDEPIVPKIKLSRLEGDNEIMENELAYKGNGNVPVNVDKSNEVNEPLHIENEGKASKTKAKHLELPLKSPPRPTQLHPGYKKRSKNSKYGKNKKSEKSLAQLSPVREIAFEGTELEMDEMGELLESMDDSFERLLVTAADDLLLCDKVGGEDLDLSEFRGIAPLAGDDTFLVSSKKYPPSYKGQMSPFKGDFDNQRKTRVNESIPRQRNDTTSHSCNEVITDNVIPPIRYHASMDNNILEGQNETSSEDLSLPQKGTETYENNNVPQRMGESNLYNILTGVEIDRSKNDMSPCKESIPNSVDIDYYKEMGTSVDRSIRERKTEAIDDILPQRNIEISVDNMIPQRKTILGDMIPHRKTETNVDDIVSERKADTNIGNLKRKTETSMGICIPHGKMETSVDDIMPQRRTETNVDDIIPPRKTETNVDDIIPPRKTETDVDDIIPPRKTETNVDDIIPPRKTETNVDDIIPPRKTKTNVDDIIPPRKTETNVDDIIPPRKTETNVDDIIPPRKTETNVDDIIPPRKTETNVDDIIPPRKTETNVDDIIPPRKTETNVDDIIPPRMTETNVDDIIPPRNTETNVDDIIPPRKTKTNVDDIIPPRKTKTNVDDITPKTSTETNVDVFIPRRKTETNVDDIMPQRNTETDVDYTISHRKTERNVEDIISQGETETNLDVPISQIETNIDGSFQFGIETNIDDIPPFKADVNIGNGIPNNNVQNTLKNMKITLDDERLQNRSDVDFNHKVPNLSNATYIEETLTKGVETDIDEIVPRYEREFNSQNYSSHGIETNVDDILTYEETHRDFENFDKIIESKIPEHQSQTKAVYANHAPIEEKMEEQEFGTKSECITVQSHSKKSMKYKLDDSITSEGPIQTSSPKIGRAKPRGFKKDPDKDFSQSDNSMLDTSFPISPKTNSKSQPLLVESDSYMKDDSFLTRSNSFDNNYMKGTPNSNLFRNSKFEDEVWNKKEPHSPTYHSSRSILDEYHLKKHNELMELSSAKSFLTSSKPQFQSSTSEIMPPLPDTEDVPSISDIEEADLPSSVARNNKKYRPSHVENPVPTDCVTERESIPVKSRWIPKSKRVKGVSTFDGTIIDTEVKANNIKRLENEWRKEKENNLQSYSNSKGRVSGDTSHGIDNGPPLNKQQNIIRENLNDKFNANTDGEKRGKEKRLRDVNICKEKENRDEDIIEGYRYKDGKRGRKEKEGLRKDDGNIHKKDKYEDYECEKSNKMRVKSRDDNDIYRERKPWRNKDGQNDDTDEDDYVERRPRNKKDRNVDDDNDENYYKKRSKRNRHLDGDNDGGDNNDRGKKFRPKIHVYDTEGKNRKPRKESDRDRDDYDDTNIERRQRRITDDHEDCDSEINVGSTGGENTHNQKRRTFKDSNDQTVKHYNRGERENKNKSDRQNRNQRSGKASFYSEDEKPDDELQVRGNSKESRWQPTEAKNRKNVRTRKIGRVSDSPLVPNDEEKKFIDDSFRLNRELGSSAPNLLGDTQSLSPPNENFDPGVSPRLSRRRGGAITPDKEKLKKLNNPYRHKRNHLFVPVSMNNNLNRSLCSVHKSDVSLVSSTHSRRSKSSSRIFENCPELVPPKLQLNPLTGEPYNFVHPLMSKSMESLHSRASSRRLYYSPDRTCNSCDWDHVQEGTVLESKVECEKENNNQIHSKEGNSKDQENKINSLGDDSYEATQKKQDEGKKENYNVRDYFDGDDDDYKKGKIEKYSNDDDNDCRQGNRNKSQRRNDVGHDEKRKREQANHRDDDGDESRKRERDKDKFRDEDDDDDDEYHNPNSGGKRGKRQKGKHKDDHYSERRKEKRNIDSYRDYDDGGGGSRRGSRDNKYKEDEGYRRRGKSDKNRNKGDGDTKGKTDGQSTEKDPTDNGKRDGYNQTKKDSDTKYKSKMVDFATGSSEYGPNVENIERQLASSIEVPLMALPENRQTDKEAGAKDPELLPKKGLFSRLSCVGGKSSAIGKKNEKNKAPLEKRATVDESSNQKEYFAAEKKRMKKLAKDKEEEPTAGLYFQDENDEVDATKITDENQLFDKSRDTSDSPMSKPFSTFAIPSANTEGYNEYFEGEAEEERRRHSLPKKNQRESIKPPKLPLQPSNQDSEDNKNKSCMIDKDRPGERRVNNKEDEENLNEKKWQPRARRDKVSPLRPRTSKSPENPNLLSCKRDYLDHRDHALTETFNSTIESDMGGFNSSAPAYFGVESSQSPNLTDTSGLQMDPSTSFDTSELTRYKKHSRRESVDLDSSLPTGTTSPLLKRGEKSPVRRRISQVSLGGLDASLSRPRSLSTTSNPLTYQPWRSQKKQRGRSLSISEMVYAAGAPRPSRSHSVGEITYNDSLLGHAAGRRRSRTNSLGEIAITSRMYHRRRSRSHSRASLGDTSFGSVAPGLQRRQSGTWSSHPAELDVVPANAAPVKRSESAREPSKNPQLIDELGRKNVERTKSDRQPQIKEELGEDKPVSPSKSDTMKSTDSASGGETLEERSSKEGSPTKEHPTTKDKKGKKKKFRIPSFSKKKNKESKESAI